MKSLFGVGVVVVALGASILHAEEPGTGADPIELKLGEHLDVMGRVPPRADYLGTPFAALLPTEKLWELVSKCDGMAVVGIKDERVAARGYFRGKVYPSQEFIDGARAGILENEPDIIELSPEMVGGAFPEPRDRRQPTVSGNCCINQDVRGP